jgi:hypothetical protein
MRRTLTIVLAGSFSLLSAQTAVAEVDLASEREAIESYQQYDQRLQDIGWRLVTGNAEFCTDAIPSVGLQLQDIRSYGGPDVARAALGLTGDFAVQTAAQGSPSGGLINMVANREITAVDGEDLNRWPADERLDWKRLVRAHDFIDQQLSARGALQLRFADGVEEELAPVTVCPTRFEVMGNSKRAVADGKRVIIGIEFPGFQYDEPLFAAAVAHEFAHNVLKHRAWLDRYKRKRRNIRMTEREADRLVPWLMANAGYDPRAAVEFMTKWGPQHDGGLFRGRTHDGWDERAEFILNEVEQIEALMAREGKADWSRYFVREIDPSKPPPKGKKGI